MYGHQADTDLLRFGTRKVEVLANTLAIDSIT